MAYCNKCGSFVEDGAKFCGKCGAKLTSNQTPNSSIEDDDFQNNKSRGSQRETVYDGEIHKCPNCGAILDAFVKNCPECGYELRGTTSTYSVQEFSRNYTKETSNLKKIDLIRTYIIPNTKEDILEFAILASSNISASSYAVNEIISGGISQRDITDAWMAKFDQAHQKANLMLTDDPYLDKINQLYADKKKELRNAKTVSVGKKIVGGIFGNDVIKLLLLPILLVVFGFCGMLSLSGSSEKELKKQAEQVESYIAEENYDAALTTAYSMSDHYSDSWSATRKNLINRIQTLQGTNIESEENHEGTVQIPTQRLTGKQMNDVVTLFSTAGFTNVTAEPIQSNLVTEMTGKLIQMSGMVEEVSVGGDTDYSAGAWVSPDTTVIIRYYK